LGLVVGCAGDAQANDAASKPVRAERATQGMNNGAEEAGDFMVLTSWVARRGRRRAVEHSSAVGDAIATLPVGRPTGD
jgi:hypothetical protein